MTAARRPLVLVPRGESPADAELVHRARTGERLAEEVLYRRHAPWLLGVATRLVGRYDEAEDVLHDAFVAAFTGLDRLRDASAVRSWLAGIVVHQCHRRLRRRRLLRTLGLDGRDDDASLARLAGEGAGPEVRLALRSIDARLASLPAGQRLAWTLRYVEGWALEHVAASAGCSLATVKRWIAAADAHVGPLAGHGIEGFR